MAFLYPQSQLRVISYNRCVNSISPHSEKSFMGEIEKKFHIRDCSPFVDLGGFVGPPSSAASSVHSRASSMTTTESCSTGCSFQCSPPGHTDHFPQYICNGTAATPVDDGDGLSEDGSQYSSTSGGRYDHDAYKHSMETAESCAVVNALLHKDALITDSESHSLVVSSSAERLSDRMRSPSNVSSSIASTDSADAVDTCTAARTAVVPSLWEPFSLGSGIGGDVGIFNDTAVRVRRSHSAVPLFGAEGEGALEIMTGRSDDMLIENFVNDQVIDQEHILMYMNGRWFELCPRCEPASTLSVHRREVDSLGVQILTSGLLTPVLHMTSPSTDKRMIYGRFRIIHTINEMLLYLSAVSGGDGIETLMSLVDNRVAVAAFCVHRISVEDVIRVADAGELLPPKATCFDPKPLAGLLVRLH
jgi:hypothetical protein